MARKFREYRLAKTGNPQVVHMPDGSVVISVVARDAALWLTALVDVDAHAVPVQFYVLAGWDDLPDGIPLSFVGTAMDLISGIGQPAVHDVRHVFQVHPQPLMTVRLR